MQAQDSARAAGTTSAEFLRRWCDERGLDPSFGRFETVASFGGSAFAIITHDAEGNERPELSRTRYDRHENKYMARHGVGVVIFAPRPDSFRQFNAAKEKWIAEGEGKALALAQLGYAVLGIGGCHNWHVKDSTQLHPELAARIRKGDTVHIAIDGDWQTNPNVAEGAALLMFAVKAAGAKPQLVQLPAKEGIDDFIARLTREGKDPHAELAKLERLSELKVPSDIPITADKDILARPAPLWIVKNLVPPGELTAIVGETSCGKTFLTMDLLLAVARKEEFWFGQRIKRHGLVVHITLEGTSLGNRRRAYQQHHKLAAPLPYVAIETPINLRQDGAALIKAIEREAVTAGLPVVLIAVDTVNRALGGGDENSSQDMGEFLAGAEAMKAAFPGAGVLLVHHVGKDASRGARGHSSFSANVGAELSVANDEKTGIRTVSITKQRDGRTDLTFNFKLAVVELGKDEDGEPVTSCAVEPSAAPVGDADLDNRGRYQLLYAWYIGDQNSRRAVSKRRVSENVLNIRLKDSKIRKADLEATFEWAKDKGYAVLAAQQPKTGEWYELHPLPEPKF
jgi:hypothetical protein